jgi:hypothetical protein
LTHTVGTARATPEVLLRAIEAHGGQERFDATERVSADLRLKGVAFPLRFQRGAFADYTGTVSTKEPRAVLAPHPEPGKRGVFERGDVRIETHDGRVIEERRNARAAFGGRRNIWWDDLDLLYFGGYALWGYVVAPFIFTRPDFEVEEIEPWREGGEEWPGLRVRWPETLPAHSREQRYYFGPDGLIRRNDYTAEVFGGWAKAAHYCWDYRDFGGFKVSTRRAAMPRGLGGRPVRAVKMVSIAIDDVRLQ